MAELNEKIRIARTLAGFSQDEVAKFLEVQRSVIVRYEQERKPADSSLEKFAALTGMPLEWFWGQPLEGLLTFRPELPGEEYSHVQIRQKETAITRDWPLFLALTGIKNLLVLKCEFGGVIIAYNNDICALVFGTHTIDTIRRLSASMSLNIESVECESVDFLNAWMQPEFLYLKNIIEYGGSELTSWAAQIEEGKPLGFTVKYHLEADFLQSTFGPSGKDSKENEKGILLYIKTKLSENNIHLENVSFKCTNAIVKGAPAEWHFQERIGSIPKIPKGAVYTGPIDGKWPTKE